MAKHEGENFKEMELWEHLAELRSRLMRAILYVVIGMIVAWVGYDWLWKLFSRPIEPIMRAHHWVWVQRSITAAFVLQLQVSFIAGLIVALPFIMGELWGFIAPGLTRSEKKGFYACVPLTLFFFLLGLSTAYLILPAAFGYFASFFDKGPSQGFVLQQDPLQYMRFVILMELAFGAVFQLPVVLMFLAYIGMVTSEMLKRNWRVAIVGCSVLGMVATPSNDAFSMLMMAVPLCILYFLSIFLVQFVERLRARQAYRPSYDTP
jgi:sec-independent protein translocase protein TatC